MTKQEEMELDFDKKDLIDYYKTDAINFANHILMDICINTFILMINLGSKIKFFYYFIEEKKERIIKGSKD